METVTGQFSDQELKVSYWYITHKLAIRRWTTVFLSVVIFFMLFFIAWQATFIALEWPEQQQWIKRIIHAADKNLATVEQLVPQPLLFSGITPVYGENRKRNDFYLQVTNENDGWLATFDYQFVGAGIQTQVKNGFILPGETKYIFDLGLETAVTEVIITNQKWEKIRRAGAIMGERLRFNVNDAKYVVSSETGAANRVSFKLTNDSAYNYWEVGALVLLFNGSNIAAMNYVVIDQLKTGETRVVVVDWHENLPRVTGLQIVPIINVFARDNLMPQTSSAGD